MTEEKKKETLGILLIAFGLFIFLSIMSYNPEEIPERLGIGYSENFMGPAGLFLAHYLIKGFIGYFSICIPILIILKGWSAFDEKREEKKLKKLNTWIKYTLLYALYGSVLAGLITNQSPVIGEIYAGKLGLAIASRMLLTFRVGGSILIFAVVFLITLSYATGFSLFKAVNRTKAFFSALFSLFSRKQEEWQEEHREKLAQKEERRKERQQKTEEAKQARKARQEAEAKRARQAEKPVTPRPQEPKAARPEFDISEPPSEEEYGIPETPEEFTPVAPPPRDQGIYKPPESDLLDIAPEQEYDMTWDELENLGQILEDTLRDFGIEGKVEKINPGPVITRFEIIPSPGVKVSKFVNLSDDLARVLRAQRIRVIAPIPGKDSVGIEIPNPRSQVVYFSEIINAPQFKDSTSPLTLVLGKTIEGKVYTTDLREMPHLLIAGATGSGKSVCINTIICSMLFKAHPKQVQLVMIDPKRLELAPYRPLRKHHLLFREDLKEEVVTSSKNAISILKSVVMEMERRYDLLAEIGVRKIEDFNVKIQKSAIILEDETEITDPLPYIVVVIDELADLMMTAAKEVEEPIARLTQMSRAVGIHLIVATQRPSVDVITGVIKANFPCRIGFYVASKTDSRTILDMNGAEKLLGRGDMLFLPPGRPEPVRLHGAFLSTDEVERIVEHIQAQPKFPKEKLPVEQEDDTDISGIDLEIQRDKLFNEAAKIVVHSGQGSVSILQRRLKVGYARAARLIDQLEQAGIVGPFDGSKAREVMIGEQDLLEMGIY